MKERPILFSGPMVRAILEGRKTQTRRLVKPQPEMVDDRSTKPWNGDPATLLRLLEANGRGCPYGQPGDRLWVRESWRPIHHAQRTEETYIRFKADDGLLSVKHTLGMDVPIKWRPSIHMPRWASRITLEVTGVRVERLRDISMADVMAEGCMLSTSKDEPLDYQNLWESINGPGSWEANPWVWVVEFRRI